MRQDDALAILRNHETPLRQFGVQSLSLFGSTTRGEADDQSDVDLIVRLAETPASGLAHLRKLDSLKEMLGGLLGCPVDVVEESLPSHIRRTIEQDIVRAF